MRLCVSALNADSHERREEAGALRVHASSLRAPPLPTKLSWPARRPSSLRDLFSEQSNFTSLSLAVYGTQRAESYMVGPSMYCDDFTQWDCWTLGSRGEGVAENRAIDAGPLHHKHVSISKKKLGPCRFRSQVAWDFVTSVLTCQQPLPSPKSSHVDASSVQWRVTHQIPRRDPASRAHPRVGRQISRQICL